MSRLRFTIRRLMIAVAVVSVVLGGYFWMARPRTIELKMAPQSLRASVDHEIFDIVLTDLLANDDFLSSRDRDGKQVSRIVFSSMTEEGYPEDLEHISGYLGDLVSEKKLDKDVVENCNDRNPPKVRFSLTEYHPSNPGIVVQDLTEEEHSLGIKQSNRGWVEVQLPGYSKDGQTALLRFTFGPTPHGSDGFYLLRKVKGRWEIIAKRLSYYA
jgi:hypothetical protein